MENTPPELARDLLALIRYFDRAERVVAEKLNRSSIGPATRAERERKRAEVTGVLSELVRAVTSGGESAPVWQLIRTAYRTGAQRAEEGLRDAGRRDISTGFSGMHQEAARSFFEQLTGRLDTAVQYAGRRIDDDFRRATLDELLVSQIAGRDRRETTRAITGQLQEKGIEGFRDSTGRRWSLADYAETAALTVSREAHTQGTLGRLTENGLDLVVVSTNPPGKPPCDKFCKRQEGKVYSISGEGADHPKLEERPPFHPRCRHVVTAYVEALNQ